MSNISSYDNPIINWNISPNPFTGIGAITVSDARIMNFSFIYNSSTIYPGQYTISCTVRAAGSSNTVTGTFVVKLQKLECTNSPFAIRKETMEDSVKLTESTTLDFIIFPNPAQAKVQLQFNQYIDSEVIVEIIEMNGSIQKFQRNVSPNILQLDMESYSEGVYQLRISNDKFNKTKKLVIIK